MILSKWDNRKKSFSVINVKTKTFLEEIGKEIAKECDGLPLDAVTVGVFFVPNYQKIIRPKS